MGFGTLYRPALADSGWDSDYDSGGSWDSGSDWDSSKIGRASCRERV